MSAVPRYRHDSLGHLTTEVDGEWVQFEEYRRLARQLVEAQQRITQLEWQQVTPAVPAGTGRSERDLFEELEQAEARLAEAQQRIKDLEGVIQQDPMNVDMLKLIESCRTLTADATADRTARRHIEACLATAEQVSQEEFSRAERAQKRLAELTAAMENIKLYCHENGLIANMVNEALAKAQP